MNQFSAKHIHIDFKNEFSRSLSQTFASPEQIKSITFESDSFLKRIDHFSEYLNKRISKYGKNISIATILRNFLYHFVTGVEQIWFKENNLYEEYKFIIHNIKSHITIGNHNLQSTALLLSDVPVDNLITEQKVFLSNSLKYIPSMFNGFSKIRELDDEIHFNQIKSQGKKHYNKGKGCFAIMEDSKHQVYFALSGAKSNEGNLKDLSAEIKTLLANNKQKSPNNNQKIQVHQCFVSNNMEYYYYHSTINPCAHEPIRILYKNDPRKPSDKEGDYACCERKILANKSIPDNDNTFFIRWAPCEKCRPAIYSRYKQIYAFKESSDKNHPYNSSKLIEFDIQRKVEYLLKEKGSITVQQTPLQPSTQPKSRK